MEGRKTEGERNTSFISEYTHSGRKDHSPTVREKLRLREMSVPQGQYIIRGGIAGQLQSGIEFDKFVILGRNP
jgi:hypothetical protein